MVVLPVKSRNEYFTSFLIEHTGPYFERFSEINKTQVTHVWTVGQL